MPGHDGNNGGNNGKEAVTEFRRGRRAVVLPIVVAAPLLIGGVAVAASGQGVLGGVLVALAMVAVVISGVQFVRSVGGAHDARTRGMIAVGLSSPVGLLLLIAGGFALAVGGTALGGALFVLGVLCAAAGFVIMLLLKRSIAAEGRRMQAQWDKLARLSVPPERGQFTEPAHRMIGGYLDGDTDRVTLAADRIRAEGTVGDVVTQEMRALVLLTLQALVARRDIAALSEEIRDTVLAALAVTLPTADHAAAAILLHRIADGAADDLATGGDLVALHTVAAYVAVLGTHVLPAGQFTSAGLARLASAMYRPG